MNLKGLGVAMVTPFDRELNVDYSELSRLTEELISGGVDFLVVLGTTGEAVTLDKEEKRLVLDEVIKSTMGRIPVVYGIGGNSTQAVCEELKNFDPAGVSAILSVSPMYNKPTQEGIYRHFEAIGKVSPLPIILYNVPGRTGSNVEASTCIRIANEIEMVQSVKEASGDMNQIQEIIDHVPSSFKVFSGDDALTLDVMKAGGHGIISVVGNALPDLFSSLVHLTEKGELTQAEELDEVIQPILPLLFEEGNPAGVKALMGLKSGYTNDVRLPLIAASQSLKEKLSSVLKTSSELV